MHIFVFAVGLLFAINCVSTLTARDSPQRRIQIPAALIAASLTAGCWLIAVGAWH